MKIIRSLTLKETISQTDQHLISLSSKTEISETFSQIRNKEPVAGSRFPVPDYQLYINICSFHTYLTVFIICRQITLYSVVSFNALHADEIHKTRNQ